MALKKNNIIEKRNVLNEIRCNNMHLQELRFFTIYLSRINARDPEKTRLVHFLLSDFLSIMGLKNVNIAELKQTTNSLLCKIVNVPLEKGYTAFQLFKECTISQNKNNEWYIEIDAHDKALPLMFDFKKEYFTYELWNALRLTSSNQLRMYEILKQYQKKGERTIEVEKLKDLLFIEKNEYSRFSNFKVKVLDSCQKALKENTDICFEYELIKKAKGKVTEIKFNIFKNKDYVDQLTLSEFINLQSISLDVQEVEVDSPEAITDELENNWNNRMAFFSEALNNEFTIKQTEVLYRIALPLIDGKRSKYGLDTSMYDYLSLKFTELNSKNNVKYRYKYLKKLIELDAELEIE